MNAPNRFRTQTNFTNICICISCVCVRDEMFSHLFSFLTTWVIKCVHVVEQVARLSCPKSAICLIRFHVIFKCFHLNLCEFGETYTLKYLTFITSAAMILESMQTQLLFSAILILYVVCVCVCVFILFCPVHHTWFFRTVNI